MKPYVLRYWESEFRWMAPQKSRSKQRLYRRRDIETILLVKRLLYEERYTIEGARRRLKELGVKKALELTGDPAPPESVLEEPREAISHGADPPHPTAAPVDAAAAIVAEGPPGDGRSSVPASAGADDAALAAAAMRHRDALSRIRTELIAIRATL